jgi:carbamoyl-phosphate synthase large subunit
LNIITIIAIVLGVGLAIAAFVWRYRTRQRAIDAIATAARSENPAERISALALVDARGVGAHLDLLIERAGVERDRDVLIALARLVARSQWEPIDDRRMMELRVWARHVLETMQETATPVSTHNLAPHPPAPPGPRAPGTFPPTPGVPSALPTGIWGPDPNPSAPGGPGVPRETVLVTSAGSASGVAAIRALVERGHRVIAVDPDREAIGLHLAHESAVVPPAGDPELAPRLCKVAVRTGATTILMTDLASMAALTLSPEILRESGIVAWMPPESALRLCADRLSCSRRLAAAGLAVPPTWAPEDLPLQGVATEVLDALAPGGQRPPSPDIDPAVFEGPWVVVPRYGDDGNRMRGDATLARNQGDLYFLLRQHPAPIVRRYVGGRPFVADALVRRDGGVAGVIASWRPSVPRFAAQAGLPVSPNNEGDVLGPTFHDDALASAITRASGALGMTGSMAVHGIFDDNGVAWITGIVPYFSDALPLAIKAGADLLGQYLAGSVGRPIDAGSLAYRDGVTILHTA